MLKPFVTHEQDSNLLQKNRIQMKRLQKKNQDMTQIASLITEKDADNLLTEIVTVESKEKASWEDCKIQQGIPYQVKQQIRLLKEFSHMFSTIPGKTFVRTSHTGQNRKSNKSKAIPNSDSLFTGSGKRNK